LRFCLFPSLNALPSPFANDCYTHTIAVFLIFFLDTAYKIDTSFQVLCGLEGSEKQSLQAIEKIGEIFFDFGVRG